MELIFVYNAKSGIFNKASDFAHKIISPKTYNCSLCALTHGNFTVHNEWTNFIKALKIPVKFLYKNDFKAIYPNISASYPAIYLLSKKNIIKLLDATEISNANIKGNLMAFTDIIKIKLKSNTNS